MHKTIRRIVPTLLALSLTVPALAQVSGATDPDLQELRAYRLTMATMTKVLQVTLDVAGALKNDPRVAKVGSLKAEIAKLQEKDELSEADQAKLEKLEAELDAAEQSTSSGKNAQTLSEMEAAIKSEPVIAGALTRAGLDAREFAKFTLAAMQAGMVAGMMKSGMVKDVPKELAATINMDNVKFMQEHEAEFEALSKSMGGRK